MSTKWPESLWCLKELELWRTVILFQEALTDYFIFQLRWISLSLAESEREVAQSCPTLCDPMDTRLRHPYDFLGNGTGVGCHFLLHEIFPTQASNPGIPHCRQTLYHQSHQSPLLRRKDMRELKAVGGVYKPCPPWSHKHCPYLIG